MMEKFLPHLEERNRAAAIKGMELFVEYTTIQDKN